MRNISLIFKQFSRSVLLVAGFAFWGFSNAYAQADAAKGEAIFKSKCTACHKIDQQLHWPGLGSAAYRRNRRQIPDQMDPEQPGPDCC
jgi:cytochrome c551/c552